MGAGAEGHACPPTDASDHAFLDHGGQVEAVGGEEAAEADAATGVGGDGFLGVEEPAVEDPRRRWAVQPHRVVEARGDQAVVRPAEVEHAQDRLEDRVVAHVGERGEIALCVGQSVDRPELVERLDPDRLVGLPASVHREVDRPGHVPHVEGPAVRPVRPRHLGHRAAAAVPQVLLGAGQVVGTRDGRQLLGEVGGEGVAVLAGREADQAHVERLVVLVATHLTGAVATAVTQHLHLVADLGPDLGGAHEVGVHRVHHLAVVDGPHRGRGGLGDEVAAVRLGPRAGLGDRGEGEVELLGLAPASG